MAADVTCTVCGRVFRVRGARATTAGACSRACAGKHRARLATRPTEERFWKFVEKTPTCWIWRGTRSPAGYGFFWEDGRMRPARVVAYRLLHGVVPPGHALHECDNPPCVNPACTFFGTHQDNMDDMVAKGRHVHGERTCTAVLTDAQVIELRRRRATGESENSLAAVFGVSRAHVSDIFRGKMWRHLPGAVPRTAPNRMGVPRRVDDDEVARLRATGLTWRAIGTRLNIVQSTAYRAWVRATVSSKESTQDQRQR